MERNQREEDGCGLRRRKIPTAILPEHLIFLVASGSSTPWAYGSMEYPKSESVFLGGAEKSLGILREVKPYS